MSTANFKIKIYRFLSSTWFFRLILFLFFIESAWIALSAAYPMVFDENTHFGIIQLYAHQWGPILPASSTYQDATGAVVRDPSFLYHYLMSFPYRLIADATSSQTLQIICLRFINILMFGAGLVLFRRLMLLTKASAALVNSCLLLFILVPIVPLLAGQINYDNLLMPMVAAALIMAISIMESLQKQDLPLIKISWLLVICLLGSLVQIEFLPIFLAIVIWIGYSIFKLNLKSWRLPKVTRFSLLAVGLALVVSTYLFLSIYGVNLVRYHSLDPSCTQALTVQQCATNLNWQREQHYLAIKTAVSSDPISFIVSWTYNMFILLFFTSSGGGSPTAYYLSINPLPIIFITALGLFVLGVGLLIFYLTRSRRWLFKGYDYMGFLLLVCLTYSASLVEHNYADYLHYGQKIAIQGRYILPIALPLLLIIGLAYRQVMANHTRLKITAFVVVFLLFLQGGGTITYIVDSTPAWYWHNHATLQANRVAKRVIEPLIITKKPLAEI